MKSILIVSDSFKGSLSSLEISEIAKDTLVDYNVSTIPVADGGEGTVDAFISALNSEKIFVKTTNALDEEISAYYTINDNNAIMEMASCAGMYQTINSNPKDTTTYGLGKLVKDAIEKGCQKIYLGLGGSSTNDAGCGLAYSLGCKFYDKNNCEFRPTGKTLKDIVRIDNTLTKDIEIIAMCDVTNPLYGEKGAAYVFGPQKGASEEDVILLDEGLRHLAKVLNNGMEFFEGSGAAGGLGYGVLSFFKGTLKNGASIVLDLCDFEKKSKDVDLIITGEGKLDSQSLDGKLISQVIRKSQNRRIILLVGISELIDFDYPVYEVNKEHLPFELVKDNSKSAYKERLLEVIRKEEINE